MTKTRRAFTIIELHVVIAVISILAELLLPAIDNARRSGQTAHCKNNLRQIGLGFLSHADKSSKNAFCSGAFDWRRDGAVTEIGWAWLPP